MKALYIIILFLASCTSPDTIIPICSNITYTIDDRVDEYKVTFVIDSDEPSITMTRENGTAMTIQNHYFGCVSIRAHEGEVVRFGECEVVIKKEL